MGAQADHGSRHAHRGDDDGPFRCPAAGTTVTIDVPGGAVTGAYETTDPANLVLCRIVTSAEESKSLLYNFYDAFGLPEGTACHGERLPKSRQACRTTLLQSARGHSTPIARRGGERFSPIRFSLTGAAEDCDAPAERLVRQCVAPPSENRSSLS